MSNLIFMGGFSMGAKLSEEAIERGEKEKVFDWNTAARRIVETQAWEAEAGLEGDWDYTGGYIFREGKPVPSDKTYVFLASLWATPQLILDGNVEDCYVLADETDWDASTYWPQSALDILDNARKAL